MKSFKELIVIQIIVGACFGGVAFSATAEPKLSLAQATEIAIKIVPGTVKSSEFEHEMGHDVYSFDIVGTDRKIHEILVNANDGKIVSNKIESTAKEAKEAAEDNK